MNKKKIILTIALILIAILVIFVLWRILTGRQQALFEKKESVEKLETASDYIKLVQPKPGAGIDSPFIIAGQAKTIDNLVILSIQDESKILFEKKVEVSNPDGSGYGDFQAEVNYLLRPPKNFNVTLTIQGKGTSPVSAETVYSVSTPLLYKLGDSQTVKIFFNNERLNLKKSCGAVFPIERVLLDATNMPKKAIELLLNGPTVEESGVDFSSAIPAEAKLLNFVIEGGTAKLNFNQSLKLSDSCQAKNFNQQIIETLKQFPEIENIFVNGELLK